MTTNIANLRIGFNDVDALFVSSGVVELAYMGDQIAWGDIATGEVQWGPHTVNDFTFAWVTDSLDFEDLGQALGILTVGGSRSQLGFDGYFYLSFANEDKRNAFESDVDTFTTNGVTLNVSDGLQGSTVTEYRWENEGGMALADAPAPVRTVSGSYLLTADAFFKPLSVDRTPLYAAFYAATKGNRSMWGVSSSDFTITPAAGASAAVLADPAENGKRFYTNQLKDRALGAALDAGSPFSRLVLGNPGGYTAGEPLPGTAQSQGYFPANAGSLMSTASVNSYGIDTDGVTPVASYASPYVDSSGAAGDSVTAWSSALDDLRATGHCTEVFAYVGYGWAYTDATHTDVDYDVAAYATGWSRAVKEPAVYPTDSLQIEWDILKTAGFDNMSFDAGTRVAKYNDEIDFKKGATRIADIRDTLDAPTEQLYEALPREADGSKKEPERYAMAKHWLLWPISSGISTDGTGETIMGRGDATGNAVVQMDGWDLDPTTTEVHVVIDIKYLLTGGYYGNTSNGTEENGTVFNWPQFKLLVARIKEEGFIPSCQSWSTTETMDDGQGGTVTPADIAKYIATDGAWDPTVSSEVIHDTFLVTGAQRWRSGNKWWNNLASGAWESTGTNIGTYLAIDSGSQIRQTDMFFSALDPGGWPEGSRIRVYFTPGDGVAVPGIEGLGSTQGDSRWFWETQPTVEQMEEDGTWGWNSTDTVHIELYTP